MFNYELSHNNRNQTAVIADACLMFCRNATINNGDKTVEDQSSYRAINRWSWAFGAVASLFKWVAINRRSPALTQPALQIYDVRTNGRAYFSDGSIQRQINVADIPYKLRNNKQLIWILQ